MNVLSMMSKLIVVTPHLQIADTVTRTVQRYNPFLKPTHNELSFKSGERIHPSFPETAIRHLHGCHHNYGKCFTVSAVTTCVYCEQADDMLCQFRLSIFDGYTLIDNHNDSNAPSYHLVQDYSERFEAEGNDYNRYWLDGAYRQARLVAYIKTTVHTWFEQMRIY